MGDLTQMLFTGGRAPLQRVAMAGQVSRNKPLPTSVSDPLYVILPAWSINNSIEIINWPLCHGTSLPQAGATVLLLRDDQNALRCVWWDGPSESTLPPPAGQLIYPGWGANPVQTQYQLSDMYYNPGAPAGGAEWFWKWDADLGYSLGITMNSTWGGDPSNGKVFIGQQFQDGDEAWFRVRCKIPSANAPTANSDWFGVAEIYGPPFDGSPTMILAVEKNDGTLRWNFDRDNSFLSGPDPWAKRLWGHTILAPHVRMDEAELIDIHVKFSTDPAVGFVEIYYNGQIQTLYGNVTKAFYATINTPNIDGPQLLVVMQYGPSGTTLYSATDYTIFHGAPSIATVREALV